MNEIEKLKFDIKKIKVEQPLITSIVPASAYLISTATLGYLKDWWLNKQK